MRLWGIGKPDVFPRTFPAASTLSPRSAAMGGTTKRSRACRLLPHIPVVAVVLPKNLKGIAVPSHVRVLVDAPFGRR